MVQEFKEFALKGNVIDLAIGLIIGSAFGKIVTSLVNDIIMPPIGYVLGKINFTDLYINLTGEKFPTLAMAQDAGVPTINYGLFINTIVDFLVISVAMFFAIKYLIKLQKPAQPETVSTKECPLCFSTINIKATRCPSCTGDLT